MGANPNYSFGMATLDELLHPITPTEFFAEYEGRKPLHIPAGPERSNLELLTWDASDGLLNRPGIWTGQNLRPMCNHAAVPLDQYWVVVQTPDEKAGGLGALQKV